jgi:hypothetical protein
MWRLIGFTDILIVIALLLIGGLLLYWQNMKSAEAIATLVGAFFGGAALLLGNWINRWNERRKACEDLEERLSKLKAMIAAELVNVACGLIDAKEMMDAAIRTVRAGGNLPDNENLTLYMPRLMPFTDNLGSELLILEQRGIDVLATLRSNLSTTRMIMDEVSLGKRPFGYLTAMQIEGSIRHDLKILSEAFELFAPERKLALMGEDPEHAITILRRLSQPAEDS